MSSQSVVGTVLIFGASPDPRLSGISSVVHDQVLALTELGYQVLLRYAGRAEHAAASKTTVYLCQAAAYQPFRWHNACSAKIAFENFDDLVSQLDLAQNRPLRTLFAQVEIVHSHADSIILRATDAGRCNNYQTLLNCVERLSGVRPKLVRTRHDDLQGGLDRFMRLTGIDFIDLSDDERQAIRNGEIDLTQSVASRIKTGGSELRSQGFSEEYLSKSIHHVWFVTAQLQLWRREQMDADYGVDVDSLAQQISCLIDNPQLAYALGQTGRRFVEEHYNYLAMGKRYSALYQSLI